MLAILGVKIGLWKGNVTFSYAHSEARKDEWQTPRHLLSKACSAFNNQDIDVALAMMTQDVSWPRLPRAARSSERKKSSRTALDNGVSSEIQKQLALS